MLDVYFLNKLEFIKLPENILGFVFEVGAGGVSGWIGYLHTKTKEQAKKLVNENLALEKEILRRETAEKAVKKNEERIKTLLQEKEILLKEVHHRIRNNMNTILGLFLLQASTLDNKEAILALEEAGNRVRSMLVLYDKLFMGSDFETISFKGYLETLVSEIVENFSNRDIVVIETCIADFELDAKKVFNLGIIINELITNTMKYAFVGRATGKIGLSASTREGLVSIVYQDDGVELPDHVTIGESSGFGFELIAMFVKHLEGKIGIERKGGTKFTIEFSAASTVKAVL
jgi:two-component sensor histidine kinase